MEQKKLNISKFWKRLEIINNSAPSDFNLRNCDKVILILSGALSPVHNMHIQCLELAKKKLEQNGKLVLCGYLCPSSSQYVQQKLKDNNIPLSMRVELCKIAVQESDWIDVNEWGYSSPTSIMLETWKIFQQYFVNSVQMFLVVGTDHALKENLSKKVFDTLDKRLYNVVCVSRNLNELLIIKDQLKQYNIEDRFLVVQDILLDKEQQSISSTQIRTLIRQNESEEIKRYVPDKIESELRRLGIEIFKPDLQ